MTEPVIALSTAWSPYRGAILAAVLAAGQEAGFQAFELGIGASPYSRQELVQVQGRARIDSVHNFLFRDGLPGGMDPRGDGLASLNAGVRREAVRRTIATLEGAAAVGARAVVVHAGAIDWRRAPALQAELMFRFEEEGPTSALREDAAALWDQRITLARPHVKATIESLREVLAAGIPVVLGLETRYGIHEIPDFYELERIIHELGSPWLGYWHDAGHAQIQENLGWNRHEDWLDRYKDRLAGIHLMDVLGCRDHLPPGQGSLDFRRFLPYLKDDTIRVLELPQSWKAEELTKGRKVLESAGLGSAT